MAATNASKPKLRLPAPPTGYKAFKKWTAAGLRRLAEMSGISLQIDGAEAASTGIDGTLRFKTGAGGGSEETHPFKATFVEGDTFLVQAGTCEGQFIAEQEIDVGSTRPVAILAYPQYALSIYSSEFVWTAAVKTGADAPVLVSSTSIVSGDISIGITSAGTEARVLIAYIDTGNVISQVTTGNIVGTFGDDGSATGKMAGSYDKNS